MVAVGFVDDEDVLLKQNAENDVLLIVAAVTMTNDDNGDNGMTWAGVEARAGAGAQGTKGTRPRTGT